MSYRDTTCRTVFPNAYNRYSLTSSAVNSILPTNNFHTMPVSLYRET